ncbi:MAG: L-serine ammonia-lyase [Rikenellaceae bacterium]
MESLKKLYKIGNGPSSSHTMGPKNAAEIFLKNNPSAHKFEVTLYGSLAATGKGHLTDVAILNVLTPHAPTEIVWMPKTFLPFHPNGMVFKSISPTGHVDSRWEVYSVGGGAITDAKGSDDTISQSVYPLSTLDGIQHWCETTGRTFWEYVDEYEDSDIWDYLALIWKTMCESIERGIEEEGVLPGGLSVKRKAASYYVRARGYTDTLRNRGLLYAYALATSEENAAGHVIVTAPTCGSSGVLPAVLYYLQQSKQFTDKKILRALATAGIFGNVVKTNASVSGADVGCQGEIGVACAMASAASCQLFGGTPSQIEYAAEMGLEHHLGLTCDPVCGLVQIPCIERNAYAAARAFDANIFATYSDGQHRVSFDKVVKVMKQTGHDIPSLYKETSEGGLALEINRHK